MIAALSEFFVLTFWITPKVLWFSFKEERKVKRLFHQNAEFKKADLSLKSSYRFKNPYRICKQHMKERGSSFLHSYGETPLTVLDEMFEKGDLKAEDCFVDLGCGRGRGVLFASLTKNCNSIGVERISLFCEKAKSIEAEKTQFFCQEICDFDMQLGSFFYFYALCLEEEELELAVRQLEKMKAGSKLITVSFPLTEYSQKFKLLSSWESAYPWGKTDLFLHLKKS